MSAPIIPPYTGTATTSHPITNKYELASIGNAEFGLAYPLDGNYIQTQYMMFAEEDFQPNGVFCNGSNDVGGVAIFSCGGYRAS